eukprot:4762667-Pyramimonas_sp.AAC.1
MPALSVSDWSVVRIYLFVRTSCLLTHNRTRACLVGLLSLTRYTPSLGDVYCKYKLQLLAVKSCFPCPELERTLDSPGLMMNPKT